MALSFEEKLQIQEEIEERYARLETAGLDFDAKIQIQEEIEELYARLEGKEPAGGAEALHTFPNGDYVVPHGETSAPVSRKEYEENAKQYQKNPDDESAATGAALRAAAKYGVDYAIVPSNSYGSFVWRVMPLSDLQSIPALLHDVVVKVAHPDGTLQDCQYKKKDGDARQAESEALEAFTEEFWAAVKELGWKEDAEGGGGVMTKAGVSFEVYDGTVTVIQGRFYDDPDAKDLAKYSLKEEMKSGASGRDLARKIDALVAGSAGDGEGGNAGDPLAKYVEEVLAELEKRGWHNGQYVVSDDEAYNIDLKDKDAGIYAVWSNETSKTIEGGEFNLQRRFKRGVSAAEVALEIHQAMKEASAESWEESWSKIPRRTRSWYCESIERELKKLGWTGVYPLHKKIDGIDYAVACSVNQGHVAIDLRNKGDDPTGTPWTHLSLAQRQRKGKQPDEVAYEVNVMVEDEARRKREAEKPASSTPLLDKLNAGEFDSLGWKEYCDKLEEVVDEVSASGAEGRPVDAVKPAAVKWVQAHQSEIVAV